eukprot:g3002.t1
MRRRRRREGTLRPGISVTFDDDGTQHEHIFTVTKMLKEDVAKKQHLDQVMLEFRESLRKLRANDYLNALLKKTELEAAEAAADLTPKQILDSVAKEVPSQTGKAWVYLDVAKPSDTSQQVSKYKKAFENRGQYTVGTQRLLRKIEKKTSTKSDNVNDSEQDYLYRSSSGTNNQMQKKVYRNKASLTVKKTFDDARTERNQTQEKNSTVMVRKSHASRKKFRSAIKSVMNNLSHEKALLESEDEYSPKPPPERAQRRRNPVHRKFRRHTIGGKSKGQKKEESLMGLIAASNLVKRNVSCGQNLETSRKASLNSVHDLQDNIACDLKLNKHVWSIRKRNGGRNAMAGRSKPIGLSSGSKRGKSRRRGGSYLMLPNSFNETEQHKSPLPETKRHWLTIQAGPSSRAAAIQTERLQRADAARRAKTGVEGLATGKHAAAAQMIRMRAWKRMITQLRFSYGRKFAFNHSKVRSQVENTVSESDSLLKKWQNGFQDLDINYAERLKNALLVRDLHRKEMNTGEHIGYVLSKIENASGKRKPNGSEILQPEDRTIEDSKTNKTENTSNNHWTPSRKPIPEITCRGPLTSFWTEARNDIITQREIKSLGNKMVNFWQTFCLLRASMPGPVAPGEVEMCRKLKTFLEDGQVVTEQIVHDLLIIIDKSVLQTNTRMKALARLLRRAAENVGMQNVLSL